MYVMSINVPLSKVFQKQIETIFNLNKSKMIIMILLAMHNADEFSEL